MGPVSLLPWLAWFLVVTPIVVHVHELAHAAAALRLTRDSVVVQACHRPFGAIGLGRLHIAVGLPALSGVCYHADSPRRHGNAKIAAAGPLASLLSGVAAAWAWTTSDAGVPLLAFAIVSLMVGLVNLIPCEMGPAGDGLHAARESDGLVILRSLGLVQRRTADRPPPMIRAPFAVLLGLVAVLAAYLSPLLLLALGAVFGHAYWVMRRERAGTPVPATAATENWDTSGSVAPPPAR